MICSAPFRYPYPLSGIRILRTVALWVAAGGAIALMSCGDSTEPDLPHSASLAPGDSTIWRGDSLRVTAVVEWTSGPRTPETVAWAVSDSFVIDLAVVATGVAKVEGVGAGTAWVTAIINTEYTDSCEVTVVEGGDVLWRRGLSASGSYAGPALDDQGRIYVSVNQPDSLIAFRPNGDLIYRAPACWSYIGPSVAPSGVAYANGFDCMQQHGPDGAIDWTVPFGSMDGGLAIHSDGSVVALNVDWNTNPASVVLAQVTASGDTAWKATLGTTTEPWQKTAPAIASNGEIYVNWIDEYACPCYLSRVGADGTIRWTVPTAGQLAAATPALVDDRIVLNYRRGGVEVFDTTGTSIWHEDWDAVTGSSAAVDGQGNIYVQGNGVSAGLRSYTRDGTLRWSVDTLSTITGFASSSPTLLTSGDLLVTCRRELCSVDMSDGSLNWKRSYAGDVRGAPAVADDGTIYIFAGEYLVAIPGSSPPVTEGWPTEGGGMGRLRRQR